VIAIGCVTNGDILDGLRTLKGRPLSEAIDRLGPPDSEMRAAGRHFYLWESRGSDPSARTSTGGAWVGNTYIPANSTTVVQQETFCRLKVEVDDNDVVTRLSFEGLGSACDHYADLR
jgi:hypothetical protein